MGIIGDYSFTFTKVNESGAGLPGAMFSLFASQNFEDGADRFVYSDKNGAVTFHNLPAGTFYLQETVAPNGYTPNSTIYKVVLSSVGFEIYYGNNFENKLSDHDNKIVNRLEFEYQPVPVILTGTKSLTGKTLAGGMFNFIVKDKNGVTAATGTNAADSSITFSKIEFNAPGTYTFTVEEVKGSLSGIIYDGSRFTVTVTVTDDGKGKLTAEVAYPDGGIVFNNSFAVTPVSVTLEGTKNLTGKTLTMGMFNFVVKDKEGVTAATGTNTADGSIIFSKIEFNAPGTYTFTVEEVKGRYSGIIYDDLKFTVTVTVSDENGKLTTEVAYPDGGIVFNNSYSPDKPYPPKTGDENLILSWIIIMLCSLVTLIGTFLLAYNKKYKQ